MSRRTFFHGLAVTLLAAAGASQAACVVARREPRRVRRAPVRHQVYRREGPRGRVVVLPRNVRVGDELEFETGYVAVVRRVYRDRVVVDRGGRTVSLEAVYL